MTHSPSNIIKALSDNTYYAEKGLEMWYQVNKIQETCNPKALLANLHLFFGLSQGPTQEIPIYLGRISNLISHYYLGGHKFSTPLLNIIAVKHIEPYRYQKVLDG